MTTSESKPSRIPALRRGLLTVLVYAFGASALHAGSDALFWDTPLIGDSFTLFKVAFIAHASVFTVIMLAFLYPKTPQAKST